MARDDAAGVVRVRFEDNGAGIAPEHLGRLAAPTATAARALRWHYRWLSPA